MPLYSDDSATRSFLPLNEIPSTFGDVINAQYESTLTELPVVAGKRLYDLAQARTSGALLPKADALARIESAGLSGHLNVDEGGISDSALSILIERKNEELQHQQTLARSKGGFGQSAARLGVALGTSLLDPINVGTAFIPVVGEARYARILGKAVGALGRAGVRAGVGAVEGVAGAAIIEPLIYTAKQQEQADYDMSDSLMNLAFGSIFGGGLHVVGGAALEGFRSLRGVKQSFEMEAPAPSGSPAGETGRSRYMDGEVLPREEIGAFYESRIQGSAVGDTVPNPRFEVGKLDASTVDQVRGVLPTLPNSVDAVRISGRAIKHLEERRPGGVAAILDRLDEIVLRPDEVLPNPDRPGRALLIKHDSPKHMVTVLEVAETLDGLEVASIYSAPDRSLRRARERKEKGSGPEGQQPAARATDSPHPSPTREGSHAAADSLPVSPDDVILPPEPDVPTSARDITAAASPQTREAALRTSVGQLGDGKAVNVEPLFSADPAGNAARAATAPDPDAGRQVAVANAVDQEIAESNTALEAAEEEAALAEAALAEHAKRFDYEPTDPDIEAAAALTKQADRWSKIANAATACLIRGA